jgi:toxin ParE1/3/4
MTKLVKRPIVIQDLISIATYISTDNLDAGDRFLYAAEATFQQLAKLPSLGKLSGFAHPEVAQIRQFPIKGYRNYLILYQIHSELKQLKLFAFSTEHKT